MKKEMLDELNKLQMFYAAVNNLVSGGRFDLRDSPKSFISQVESLCKEMQGKKQ